MVKLLMVLLFFVLCVIALSTTMAFAHQIGGVFIGVMSILFLVAMSVLIFRNWDYGTT